MKTFTPDNGFDATENGHKVRYEAGQPREIDDELADHYVSKGLGSAVKIGWGSAFVPADDEPA